MKLLFLFLLLPIFSIAQYSLPCKNPIHKLTVVWHKPTKECAQWQRAELFPPGYFPKIKPAPHRHSAVENKPVYDPILYIDSSQKKKNTIMRNNIITYVVGRYTCKICGLEYGVRENVDTFSTKRKAKYSNLKYKH